MSVHQKMYKTRSSLKKFSVGFKDCCRLHKRHCRCGAAQALTKISFFQSLNIFLCNNNCVAIGEGTTEKIFKVPLSYNFQSSIELQEPLVCEEAPFELRS